MKALFPFWFKTVSYRKSASHEFEGVKSKEIARNFSKLVKNRCHVCVLVKSRDILKNLLKEDAAIRAEGV